MVEREYSSDSAISQIGRASQPDTINSQIAATATARNIPYAQVYLAFNGPNGDIDPDDLGLLSFDDLHPNGRGHRRIADLLRGLGYSPFEL